ncbi:MULTISPECIES: glycosyltransferase [Metabacillus]|uniref:Glycosyl transferase n=2 Tax=Metabacillus TaxID=2675233 RepID=A0A179T4D2_9BACI|nr:MULTISPECIES: glycosyltransferase [Metabacillus]OAS88208.1 glycosyl transferase [Metabacillus litoralis]QNF27360.1 glycosyltransferase [Metabacillus sp. KUDC1714]
MRKKVCMFVWNHFTNDARVLRECTALSESNYDVDLICIHDPKDPNLAKFEERNPYFRVHRVRRYPILLEIFQKAFRLCSKYKSLAFVFLLCWLFMIYQFPVPAIMITVFVLLLVKTKLKAIWISGSIILRMIGKGLKKNYDIYHSNDLNTLPQGFIASKVRIKQKKLIYDSHEVQTSRTGYEGNSYGKLESFLINKIDAMIVENHTRAAYNDELYKFYPHVVHNYPFKQVGENQEKAPLHDMLGLPKNEKILLYQGGIQTGRGLDKLVQAAPLFKEGTLVLVGDGKIKPKLEKMVADMKLQDKVKFIPKVPLAELPTYTRNAYLGFQVLNNVCFNHFSASSNKLFEYMMNGIPVIACSFPEIQKVVEEENVGVCVDSHDPVSIAEGVNYLLDNTEKHQQMKHNTFIAKEKYNWELEKRHLLAVYQNVNESKLSTL